MDTILLKDFLFWIAGGVGSGAAAFWLFENIGFLSGLTPKPKRFWSLVVSAALAMLAYAASVVLGYSPTPADAQAWLQELFAIAFVAVNGSQLIHGALRL